MSLEGCSLIFDRCPKTLDKKRVRAFFRLLRKEVVSGAAFNCMVSNDAFLRKMNRDFLRHDYPTDVLSFPEAALTAHLGDIAISYQRAAEQAAGFRHSLDDEICILMLHGLLHLTGMDHETDKGQMARAEAEWRTRFALPNSLLARAGKRK